MNRRRERRIDRGRRMPQKPAARVVRAQLAAERRRRRAAWITTVSVSVLLLAALAGWAIYAARQPDRVETPKNATSDGTGTVVGDGPVTVDVYLDFLCPHCKALDEEAGPTLRKLIDDHRAKVVYHPVAFLDRASTTRYSTRSAASSGCAANQDKFVEYSHALFTRQPAEGGPGLTDDELIQVAGSVGIIDPEFARCVRDGTFRPWVDRVNSGAARKGVNGTPTVLVNGQPVTPPTAAAIEAAVRAAPK